MSITFEGVLEADFRASSCDYNTYMKLVNVLTYSNTYYGEHTTSVNNKGKDIQEKDLIEVGKNAGIKEKKAEKYWERFVPISVKPFTSRENRSTK